MASKSETGHAVNANNFERVYFHAKEEPTYNPQDPAIGVLGLKDKNEKVKDVRATYRDKAGPWMKVVNDREAAMPALPAMTPSPAPATVLAPVLMPWQTWYSASASSLADSMLFMALFF